MVMLHLAKNSQSPPYNSGPPRKTSCLVFPWYFVSDIPSHFIVLRAGGLPMIDLNNQRFSSCILKRCDWTWGRTVFPTLGYNGLLVFRTDCQKQFTNYLVAIEVPQLPLQLSKLKLQSSKAPAFFLSRNFHFSSLTLYTGNLFGQTHKSVLTMEAVSSIPVHYSRCRRRSCIRPAQPGQNLNDLINSF